MKFRKKPVVIEAMQFTGANEEGEKCLKFIQNGGCAASATFGEDDGEGNSVPTITIPTLEGDMTAMPGDWIIRGVKGEFYPCKPDIFEATYDPAE